MSSYSWSERFTTLHARCREQYQRGNTNFNAWFSEEDHSFLRSIGCKPREFFDYVEDYPDLSLEAALLIAAARRDFFLYEQDGKISKSELKPDELPARDATLEGIPWLPRILAKSRAKLRGEMHPDIMYGCGGDRGFLTKYDIHPADFLRFVWAAKEEDAKVAAYVKSHRHSG